MLTAALLSFCAITAIAGEVCKEPDTNKTLTCSGAKPDCCVGYRYGPSSCYNKSEEECCQNVAHGVKRPCPTGKCLHGGARASERVACCSADTTPCNGYFFYARGECCKADQQCCGETGKCCSADSVCCSNIMSRGTDYGPIAKCCPAGSTCCNSYWGSACCAKGEKCVVDSQQPGNPNATKCVSTLPTFMTVV